MQVLLNSETQIKNHLAMTAHLHRVVGVVLGHYGERITRIDGHLSDANSAAKSDTDDIHLTLEASLPGLAPVVVKDRASTAHQAIQGAVDKLDRAVAHVLGKRDSRRERSDHEGPSPD
jgi:ribosome-associated translation inhibitor RaiA